MKTPWAIMFLFFFSSLLYAQMTVTDFLSAKKILNEAEILASLEKKEVVVSLQEKDWDTLREAGFSPQFLERLKQLVTKQRQTSSNPVPDTKSYKLEITVRPVGAGRVLCTPAPDAQGNIPEGTVVKIHPEPIGAFLFDHWEGDLTGYQPLQLRINRNCRLVAVFQKPYPEAHPPKIEDPEEFKDTRKAGHTYEGTILGLVEGQGQNKDWGMEAEVDYKYTYHIHYVSTVLFNDGYRIKEKRHFDSVQEMLFVSQYRMHLDLTEEFAGVKAFMEFMEKGLKTTGAVLELLPSPGAKEVGKILRITGDGVKMVSFLSEAGLNQVQKVRFSQEQIESALRVIGKKNLSKFQEYISNPKWGAVFGYAPNMKMLEGKTFNLEYEDGIGLVKVEILDSQQILTAHEKELLQRAFYLSDYYIFRDVDNPKRKIQIGEIWHVDAKTLAGVLDPRLRHRAQGNIRLYRASNPDPSTAVFIIKEGNVQMVPLNHSKNLQGEIRFTPDQKIFYDLDKQYVKEASFSAKAKYHQFSSDHLFFGTRFLTEPNITIKYECKCTKME